MLYIVDCTIVAIVLKEKAGEVNFDLLETYIVPFPRGEGSHLSSEDVHLQQETQFTLLSSTKGFLMMKIDGKI